MIELTKLQIAALNQFARNGFAAFITTDCGG